MSARGNSLMVTMIALAVLMVLVVGAIRFTGTNRDAALSKLKGDRLGACADTARRYLLSSLRQGADPTQLMLASVSLKDDASASKQTRMGVGAYGDDLTVTPGTSRIGVIRGQPSPGDIRDLTNVIGSDGIGGTMYRVVMKCQEAGTLTGATRESEIEFAFRYGI
jgi:hypothetical protein